MKALQKYLARYAEPESHLLETFAPSYQHVLVLPVFDEDPNCLNILDSVDNSQQDLLLLIINRPETSQCIQWAKKILAAIPPAHWHNQTISLHRRENQSDILIVDRCINGEPIPAKQGVGLARKIGNDIACHLIARQNIRTPYIFNTDADTRLPRNYFAAITEQSSIQRSAFLYPFQHRDINDNTDLATAIYELKLRYYLAGLQWAGSPYAFHTIGSTLAVHYECYAKVRGFPKRSGGEDFYLLNKLAKVADIESLTEPVLTILARDSHRVPFGTGPASKQIREQDSLFDTPFYHPHSFAYLKGFLQSLNQFAMDKPTSLTLSDSDAAIATVDKQILAAAGDFLQVETALEHACKQGRTEADRRRHLQHWFDGFQTLKLVHFMRDTALPMTNLRTLLNTGNTLDAMNNSLNALEPQLNRLNTQLFRYQHQQNAKQPTNFDFNFLQHFLY